MPKQTKIKELLKEAHELSRSSVNGDAKKLAEIDACFHWVKSTIRPLRKENKRLKKENFFLKTNRAIGSVCFDVAVKQRDLLRKELETPKPVAEFKCAKTNKPEKNNYPYCAIVKDLQLNIVYYSIIHWEPTLPGWSLPCNTEVIAFTETHPGEIVNALNIK